MAVEQSTGNEWKRPWIYSPEAKQYISGFCQRLLAVAEEIRVAHNYPDDSKYHFFGYSMGRHGYFVKESDSDWINSEQRPRFWPEIFGNLKFAEGAIGFNHFPLSSEVEDPKKVVRPTDKEEQDLPVEFIEKLGFIKGGKVTGEQVKRERERITIRIIHPDLPFAADFSSNELNSSFPKRPGVWFLYYETYEHQLPLDTEGPFESTIESDIEQGTP